METLISGSYPNGGETLNSEPLDTQTLTPAEAKALRLLLDEVITDPSFLVLLLGFRAQEFRV